MSEGEDVQPFIIDGDTRAPVTSTTEAAPLTSTTVQASTAVTAYRAGTSAGSFTPTEHACADPFTPTGFTPDDTFWANASYAAATPYAQAPPELYQIP